MLQQRARAGDDSSHASKEAIGTTEEGRQLGLRGSLVTRRHGPARPGVRRRVGRPATLLARLARLGSVGRFGSATALLRSGGSKHRLRLAVRTALALRLLAL